MVSEGFWNEIKDTMQAKFQQGEFMLGLALGIEQAGQQLQLHFPYQRDDEQLPGRNLFRMRRSLVLVLIMFLLHPVFAQVNERIFRPDPLLHDWSTTWLMY